jgi:hypothetical protein
MGSVEKNRSQLWLTDFDKITFIFPQLFDDKRRTSNKWYIVGGCPFSDDKSHNQIMSKISNLPRSIPHLRTNKSSLKTYLNFQNNLNYIKTCHTYTICTVYQWPSIRRFVWDQYNI